MPKLSPLASEERNSEREMNLEISLILELLVKEETRAEQAAEPCAPSWLGVRRPCACRQRCWVKHSDVMVLSLALPRLNAVANCSKMCVSFIAIHLAIWVLVVLGSFLFSPVRNDGGFFHCCKQTKNLCWCRRGNPGMTLAAAPCRVHNTPPL